MSVDVSTSLIGTPIMFDGDNGLLFESGGAQVARSAAAASRKATVSIN